MISEVLQGVDPNIITNMKLNKLNKTQLLEKALELQILLKEYSNAPPSLPEPENLQADLLTGTLLNRLNILENSVDNLKKDNKRLKKEFRELNDYVEDAEEKIIDLEIKVNKLDQYMRRENIVISGIPDFVPQLHLEEKVSEILQSIDVKVESNDFHAIHRLQKDRKDKDQPAKVIVRFVNRKNAIKCLTNKKKLFEQKSGIFINNNLCQAYQEIYNDCRKLKYEKRILNFWTYNGIVNIKFTDDRQERPKKVLSIDKLYEFLEVHEGASD